MLGVLQSPRCIRRHVVFQVDGHIGSIGKYAGVATASWLESVSILASVQCTGRRRWWVVEQTLCMVVPTGACRTEVGLVLAGDRALLWFMKTFVGFSSPLDNLSSSDQMVAETLELVQIASRRALGTGTRCQSCTALLRS